MLVWGEGLGSAIWNLGLVWDDLGVVYKLE